MHDGNSIMEYSFIRDGKIIESGLDVMRNIIPKTREPGYENCRLDVHDPKDPEKIPVAYEIVDPPMDVTYRGEAYVDLLSSWMSRNSHMILTRIFRIKLYGLMKVNTLETIIDNVNGEKHFRERRDLVHEWDL